MGLTAVGLGPWETHLQGIFTGNWRLKNRNETLHEIRQRSPCQTLHRNPHLAVLSLWPPKNKGPLKGRETQKGEDMCRNPSCSIPAGPGPCSGCEEMRAEGVPWEGPGE